MLTALVLKLKSQCAVALPSTHGAMTYAAVLKLLAEIDSVVAKTIHDCPKNKPVTISMLYGQSAKQAGTIRFAPDSPVSLRITGLTAETSLLLKELERSAVNKSIEVGGNILNIISATSDGKINNEAGTTNTESIVKQCALLESRGEYPVRIVSPAVFNTTSGELPFPLPRLFWGSIADSWAEHGVGGMKDMRTLLESEVVIGRWRGESIRVELGKIKSVGCIGEYNYRVLRNDKALRFYLEILRKYAFYSGSGRYTAFGLGQVR